MTETEGLMIVVKSGPEEAPRIEEALRVATAMLGYDTPPAVAFIGDGLRCLRPGAFSDETLSDYLQAVADLGGIHAVRCKDGQPPEIDASLAPTMIDMDELAEMMKEYPAVASY